MKAYDTLGMLTLLDYNKCLVFKPFDPNYCEKRVFFGINEVMVIEPFSGRVFPFNEREFPNFIWAIDETTLVPRPEDNERGKRVKIKPIDESRYNFNFLPPEENEIYALIAKVHNLFSQLDRTHPNELEAFADGIHQLQSTMGLRILRREHGDLFVDFTEMLKK
jgi:hypothetical protein